MMSAKVLFLSAFFVLASTKSVNPKNGDARFFGYRYTSTEIVPKMITSVIPSSCVQVEPSLPPCRNVRNLDEFPRFLGGYQEDVIMGREEVLPTIHTTQLGWGEYLGIYAPTVTVTAIHLQTTTVLDPRTVVTFSVKGCKPSRLPLDLHLCPAQKPGSIVEEIKATPTMEQIVASSTPYKEVPLDGATNDLGIPSNNLDSLQPTEQVITVDTNNGETDPLTTS